MGIYIMSSVTQKLSHSNYKHSGQECGEGGKVSKRFGLSFLRSPVEIVSSPATGRVSSVRLEINTLEVCRLIPDAASHRKKRTFVLCV